MALRHATLLAFVFCCLVRAGVSQGRPNIVLILADDLGWNDVSFHGSNQIPTPNIDALAYTGIILNSHYVPALCTPSRASLLSGKYPTTMGMQHLVILAPEPWGLPLEETLMPEYFKRHGYATHAVGKWHLGFYDKRYTPTYRGFDTHFGYWNGYQDYYDHTMEDDTLEGAPGPLKGYDMRRGLEIDYKSRGEYSTDAFTNEAVDVIKNHNSSQGPLFLYLAHLSPHSGNPDKPFQAPDDEIAKHSDIRDPERRVYAAMVTKLDEGVGKVVSALKESNLLDNSIILFMSDNGAVTFGVHSNRGSNFPLRGLKESPWEGGVRGVAALWSPLLNRTRRVSNQLMHVSDWLPTLYSAAGLDTAELGEIDGMNLWDALSQDGESPRTEVFNNYDEIEGYSSLRVGPWKYVEGTAQGGEVDLWYGESGKDFAYKGYDEEKVFNSEAGAAIVDHLREKQTENSDSSKKGNSHSLPGREEISKLRRESTITCNEAPFKLDESKNYSSTEAIIELKRRLLRDLESIRYKYLVALSAAAFPDVFKELNDARDIDEIFGCDPLKEICLFNLDEDPCERINLAKLFPGVVENVKNRLNYLIKGVRKPKNLPGDPFSDPALHNGTWTNWRNEDGVAISREYEEATELFLYSILERDLILILYNNVIFKIVSSPISFLFNHLFIENSKELASAFSFVIIIVFFAAIYNFIKRAISLDEMDGNDGKELSIDEIKKEKNKYVKR